MGAELNRLISQGGTGIASPIQRYQQARKDVQGEQMNRLAMQSTQQGMDINAQKQQMLQQEQATKSMASLGKYLDTIPEEQRAAAFESQIPKFQQMGLPNPPEGVGYEQVKGRIKQAQLEVYGTPETPTKRTFAAGVNNKGQNLVTDRLYQDNKVIEESKPYVKKEIDRTAQVDEADYSTKSAKDKAKNEELFREESIYKTVHGLNKLEELYNAPNYVGGLSGDIISGGNSILQQFRQVTGLTDTGGNIPIKDIEPAARKGKEYSSLRKAAMNNDQRSALIIEIAYNIAKSRDKRVTDADFRYARKMVDASADKEISLQLIKDLKDREVSFYNAGSRIRSDKKLGEYRPYTDENYNKYYPGMNTATPPPVQNAGQQVIQGSEPDFDAIADGIVNDL